MKEKSGRSFFYVIMPAGAAGLLLLAMFFLMPGSAAMAGGADQRLPRLQTTTVFVNEIHYDNSGADTEEGIEIAGPAGTNLSGWSIVLYNGNGGTSYGTTLLSGVLTDQQNGFGTLFFPITGIQNGAPDALALVNPSNSVVQFLSYEGTLTAVDGPANGMLSTDIGVLESGADPVGYSLQLGGNGSVYEDFTWNDPATSTYGAVNTGQKFGVSGFSDLALSETGPIAIQVGGSIIYTITLQNTGIPTATNVILTDTLPLGCSFVSQNSSFALTNPASGVYVWDVGNVISGTSVSFNLVISTDAGASAGTVYTNTAVIHTTAAGDDPANNTVQWKTTAYEAVSIHNVQHVVDPVTDDVSPYVGQVVWVEGVVVAQPGEIDTPYRAFVLEEPAGGPWSGLQIYKSSGFSDLSAPEGAWVRVLGTVTEYSGMTELNLSSGPSAVEVISTGNTTPAPEILLTAAFTSTGTATAEQWESVLIEFQNAKVTDTSLGYGEWLFDDGSGAARADDLGARDGDLSYVPETSDNFDFIRGIGWYGFGSYRLNPRYNNDIRLQATEPAISKSAPVLVSPGSVFTYTLDIKNVLAYDLTGVIVTDSLPTNVVFAYASSGGLESGGMVSWTLDSLPAFSNVQVTFAVTATDAAGVYIQNRDYAVRAANFVTPTFGAPVATIVDDALHIHHIQGAVHVSPLVNQSVSGVQGVVTALASRGFYLQDLAPDSDIATSEGIFVYLNASPQVHVGDIVSVSGTVTEYYPGGVSSGDLSVTELTSDNAFVTVLQTGQDLPVPIVIGVAGRIPPSQVIEDDANGNVETSGIFDPASDGIDFYESLEGMLVEVRNALSVGPTNNYGEIVVVGDQGVQAGMFTPRGGLVIQPDDFNPERIILDDVLVANPELSLGAAFSAPITGVMDYSFGNFKLLNINPLQATMSGVISETAAAPASEQLSVATFNVENLDPKDGAAKFASLADEIVNNLSSPDILALEEIQDSTGPTDDGVVTATLTYQTLIAAIQTAGGPTYDFRDISPENNQDGGELGGNIRVGFLFQPDRVIFVDRPGGTATEAVSITLGTSGIELTFSPGRIDPTDPAFLNSRKPLAGEFIFNGQKLILIANHLNSKGGDEPLFGRSQPPILSSEAQRNNQAQLVNDFVKSVLALDASARVIVLGDLNDFQFSTTVTRLAGSELTNLVDTLPLNERYSYVYDGNSEELDHILVSQSLLNRVSLDIVHINAEFNPNQRPSDHDPVLARLSLPYQLYLPLIGKNQAVGAAAPTAPVGWKPAPLLALWSFVLIAIRFRLQA